MENERVIMRCDRASRLIQLYIDQQLFLYQVRVLERHLSTCSACREELFFYQEIDRSLKGLELVAEPVDLTRNIIKRVAFSTRQAQAERQEALTAFRPSFRELLAAMLLATFAMLGVVLSEPSLRAILPFANGHDAFSLFFIHLWNSLLGFNSDTLMLCCWVVGTLLGVWISLLVVGAEVRHSWRRAVVLRLPVL
jgi:hypothetical protein